MFFHVILTDDCNLCCRYCRGKAFESLFSGEDGTDIDTSLPAELSYDLAKLYSFLRKDFRACITFYGGEPLVRADLVREIMDHAPVRRFMIQTNGLLLDELGSGYVNRMETILVSIDGPEETTDCNRGAGTFARVMKNVHKIIEEGFSGEIIARMTIAEGADVARAVGYLDTNPEYSFPSIHWQLDADFSENGSDETFRAWLSGSYNPGIRQLIDCWTGIMEQEGRVARWYPFLQTAEDLLRGEESALRCGAGYANYTINTDGHIGPCPAMVGMRDFYVGHISTADPLNLPRVGLQGSCTGCGILGFCGGRCLYAGLVRSGKDDRRAVICGTVRALREGMLDAIPKIRSLIDSEKINPADFSHTRFNGCEIIP